jgi:hypothetical protein
MTPMQELVLRWQQHGVAARPGVPQGKIVAFEKKHSIVLPQDFRDYLLLANGTSDEDDELIRFSPLEEMRPVIETWGTAPSGEDVHAGCFVFAGYAIHCWDYAIQLQGASGGVGRIFRIEDGQQRQPPMAVSFSDWVSMYLRQPDLLHSTRR